MHVEVETQDVVLVGGATLTAVAVGPKETRIYEGSTFVHRLLPERITGTFSAPSDQHL